MIDRRFLDYRIVSGPLLVERGQLRFFAEVIGETNPVHLDLLAARAAGHPDLLAPPTFLFTLELDTLNWIDHLHDMGIDVAAVLHGEQHFEYFAPVHAGDEIRFSGRISDIFDRRDGQLEFMVYDSEAHNQDDVLVARLRRVIIVRHREGAAR